MRIHIRNGFIARADGCFNGDLLLDGGKVLEVGGPFRKAAADEVIDATGCIVMPGGVDIHTHCNLSTGLGRVDDGFAAATRSALWGGTTTIVEHPGFGPQNCSLGHMPEVFCREAEGQCHTDYAFHLVFQQSGEHGCISPERLAELPAMVERGFPTGKIYLTYDGRLNDNAVLQTLTALREAGGLAFFHAEHHEVATWLTARLRAESPLAAEAYPRSRPDFCEGEAVGRVIALGRAVGAPVYIVHLSTAAGLGRIVEARRRGQTVYAETCPQYLVLTLNRYEQEQGRDYIMAPPLRRPPDTEALWRGLAQGHIDVIATDHCAYTRLQKESAATVFDAPGGIPGLETRLPLVYTYGVLKDHITLEQMVSLCATAPARIAGLGGKGRLEAGADADVTILDPDLELPLSPAHLHHPGDYAPFAHLSARGWARHVLLRGMPLIRDRVFTGEKPQGRLLLRKLG